MPDEFKILVINPGSTSTKFALYADDRPVLVKQIRHTDQELAPFRGRPILEQQEFRAEQITSATHGSGADTDTFSPGNEAKDGAPTTNSLQGVDAVVARGGLLPALRSGTYEVDQTMLDELQAARRGEHASNLGAFLANRIANQSGAKAYIVDPVSVDEWDDVARFSGSALFERQCLSHALNSRAVAKRYTREQGRSYESLRLIVAHLGSGISVSAHAGGRMIDVTNSREEGAFSTERTGTVPVMQLVDLCFSGRHTRREIETLLFREGGLQSYLGTKDLMEVERRIKRGDSRASTVVAAMAYQIAKEIGAMATVLQGRVDALLITGGMAHSERLVRELCERAEWIAPVAVYPGEDELQALAEGALRVLRGEEEAQVFGAVMAAAT